MTQFFKNRLSSIYFRCSNGSIDSTEVLDTEDGSVTMASPMNSKRSDHGMGVVTINGEERLAVVGGCNKDGDLDSVELYNNQTGKWETTNIKMKEAMHSFGFLSVKLTDVVSHLQGPQSQTRPKYWPFSPLKSLFKAIKG